MGARAWVFTINTRDGDVDEFNSRKNYILSWETELPPTVKGITFQLEKGDEGVLHLQGFVCFNTTHRLPGVKRVFQCEWMWAQRCENRARAIVYARKEETRQEGPWTFGEVDGRQGARTDIEALHNDITAGHQNVQLWDDHFGSMLRFHKAVDVYRQLRIPNTRAKPRVRVYWGPTGTGKSHRADEEARALGEPYYPEVAEGQVWFDNYDGVSPIIIDEFTGQWNVNFMKRLLDKYPLQVAVKGSFVKVQATDIWITSNQDPETWWWDSRRPPSPVDRAAIMRRIDVCLNLREVYQE